ncbi:hypothetical protein GM658_20070 [Pseudoduganella eburnea]|uniref:Uncharacterized protein n=1 Tax=Massilia eburnea TaxID=1776165 RepID=A0A6L6QLV6_9BURK|nr:hypothetical protein [Massilia eburnea]MTW12907.1 hypothetical protein [Massilia eburnea]
MSTISSVGSTNFSVSSTTINQNSQPPRRVDSDGENVGRPHRGGGGHRIGGAIGEALQQLGLNLPPPPSATSGAGGTPPAGATQAPGTSDVGQAFHEFAHTLFQALRAQGQGQELGDGSGHPGQNRLEQSVQSLLQKLASSTETGGDGTLSDLTDAFNNLVNVLGGSSGTDGSATAPTLQAFLEKFQQDLQSGGNVSTSGLKVNTSA